jgi:hypothetical protein
VSSTTPGSQAAGQGRGGQSAARGAGRHERIGDALIASYLRELLDADPAAAQLRVDLPAVSGPPVVDTLDDAELAS